MIGWIATIAGGVLVIAVARYVIGPMIMLYFLGKIDG